MKLFWHIGPHKTGTTSVQSALAAHAATGRASYYYPPTTEFGPGHAALAWNFLGLNQRSRNRDALQAALDEAAGLGFERVVLSSEEFSRALLADGSFEAFVPICENVECELVITLRPLKERVYPEIQELIKNGQQLHLNNVQDLVAAFMGRPGLRADFLAAAIEGSKAAAATVIMVDRETPHKLFEAFSTIVGEKLHPPKNPQSNASYPFVKTAWLEILNRHASVKPGEARAAVDAAFNAATRQLDRLTDVAYPQLPPPLARYLDGVWQLQLAYLGSLAATGRVRIL